MGGRGAAGGGASNNAASGPATYSTNPNDPLADPTVQLLVLGETSGITEALLGAAVATIGTRAALKLGYEGASDLAKAVAERIPGVGKVLRSGRLSKAVIRTDKSGRPYLDRGYVPPRRLQFRSSGAASTHASRTIERNATRAARAKVSSWQKARNLHPPPKTPHDPLSPSEIQKALGHIVKPPRLPKPKP